jgi:hypothetical protein
MADTNMWARLTGHTIQYSKAGFVCNMHVQLVKAQKNNEQAFKFDDLNENPVLYMVCVEGWETSYVGQNLFKLMQILLKEDDVKIEVMPVTEKSSIIKECKAMQTNKKK